jgi:hypothetical protein
MSPQELPPSACLWLRLSHAYRTRMGVHPHVAVSLQADYARLTSGRARSYQLLESLVACQDRRNEVRHLPHALAGGQQFEQFLGRVFGVAVPH